MPTGDFRNEDGLIPISEGQWDYDFFVLVGRSFWPIPVYGNVDVGYRVRLENEQIFRDPGDEWLFNAEVGYNITRRLLVAANVEMLRVKAGTDFGFKNRSQIKRITYLSPTRTLTLRCVRFQRRADSQLYFGLVAGVVGASVEV